MTKPKPIENWEESLDINPSYDKSLPIDVRLADFLSAYHIELNGVTAHEPFMLTYEGKPNDRCDTESKQRLRTFIAETLKQEIARVGKEIIGQDEDVLNKTADKWNKNPQKIMNRNKLRLEQRKHLQEILKAL